MSHKLSDEAENIRKSVKRMIPQTAGDHWEMQTEKALVLTNDGRGNLTYGGDSLGKRVSSLINKLNIGKCGIHERRKWTVAHFSESTEIIKKSSPIYLIALSDNVTIEPVKEQEDRDNHVDDTTTPDANVVLREGYFTSIDRRSMLSPEASVIFVTSVRI